MIHRLLFCVTMILSIALMSGSANADTQVGYPCNLQFTPVNFATPGNGNLGAVQFNLYTGVGCQGSFVAGIKICSTGAAANDCNWRLDETQLMSLFNAIMVSMNGQNRGITCTGFGQFCIGMYGLSFY